MVRVLMVLLTLTKKKIIYTLFDYIYFDCYLILYILYIYIFIYLFIYLFIWIPIVGSLRVTV